MNAKHGPLDIHWCPYVIQNEASLERWHIVQAWAERRRMSEVLGWWESLPPLPDMLKQADPLAA